MKVWKYKPYKPIYKPPLITPMGFPLANILKINYEIRWKKTLSISIM